MSPATQGQNSKRVLLTTDAPSSSQIRTILFRLVLPASCAAASESPLGTGGWLYVTGLQAAAVSSEVMRTWAEDVRTPASCRER